MIPIGDEHWMDDGDCVGMDVDVFFAVDDDSGRYTKDERAEMEEKARRVCGSCEQRIKCLEFQLQSSFASDYGIWGGTDRQERRRLRKVYKRAGQVIE